jgi:uncharacterized membrane protein
MRMKILVSFCFLFLPLFLNAQEVHQELQETVRAEVLEIMREEERDIIGTDTNALVQEVRARIQEGVRKGDVTIFENDLMKLDAGDSIYVNRLIGIDGTEYYAFKDVDRHGPLLTLFAFFACTLILFSGFHGFRALLSLFVSVVGIFLVLVPLLLHGYDPVFSSIAVAGVILALVLFITHGFRAHTMIAFLGTFGAIVITGIVALIWTHYAHFTGLSSDEAIYLNFSTKGALDFGGLLLGSIIIGILGILDDVAITQASVVAELKRANGLLRGRELYTRALRVGRDHIGSLVNTLAFAYIGASLPLILLLSAAGSDIILSLNQELVAVELVRIFVGSIGLILAVPLTTLIAVVWYDRHVVTEVESACGHIHIH